MEKQLLGYQQLLGYLKSVDAEKPKPQRPKRKIRNPMKQNRKAKASAQ